MRTFKHGGGMSLSFFSLNYSPAAWVPALAATAGFFLLEAIIHGRHSGAVEMEMARGLLPALRTLWDIFYLCGYILYFAPLLLPTVRNADGVIRRVLVGATIQLASGGVVLLAFPVSLDFTPCLHLANALFLTLAVGRYGRLLLSSGMLLVVVLLALSTLATARHDLEDILIGLSLGALAYKVAFSKELSFLDSQHPWRGISYEIKDVANLFWRNSRDNWETAYAAGQWKFLDSPAQRARHYCIAGAIQDLFPKEAEILDVGCGCGTLLRALARPLKFYTGIDFSEEAIKQCRTAFAGDDRCRFEVADFAAFNPADKFDVVVLNEVLYYFPLRSVDAVFRKALGLLRNRRSLLVISMNRNPKAKMVWWRLSKVQTPIQSLRVSNVATGSYWSIMIYSAEGESIGRTL